MPIQDPFYHLRPGSAVPSGFTFTSSSAANTVDVSLPQCTFGGHSLTDLVQYVDGQFAGVCETCDFRVAFRLPSRTEPLLARMKEWLDAAMSEGAPDLEFLLEMAQQVDEEEAILSQIRSLLDIAKRMIGDQALS